MFHADKHGLSPDGNDKIRGIALRRSDTPRFVATIQKAVLEILGKEADPTKLPNRLPEILEMVDEELVSLKKREVPLEQLVVSQTLSRVQFPKFRHSHWFGVGQNHNAGNGKVLLGKQLYG